MELGKRIIVSTIALALASQFTALAAKGTPDGLPSGENLQTAPAEYEARIGIIGGSIDPQLIESARPMVDKAPEGLFITAPYINSLIVMNVRVYDNDGKQVMSARSFGESFELMAVDLPEGKYRYEAVTVFSLDEPIGQGADYTDEGISRNYGSFTVSGKSIINDDMPTQRDEASLLDRVIKHATYLAGVTLDVFVSSASADTTVTGTPPDIFFRDTFSLGSDWKITGDSSPRIFSFSDLLGANNHTFFKVSGTVGSSLNSNSIVIDSDGDIHWASSRLNFDKGGSELSLGWSSSPADFSISALSPDIRFHDETDTSEVEFELNNGVFRLYGRRNDSATWRDIFQIDAGAPADSLLIGSSGLVTIGASANTSNSILTIGNSGSSRSQMTLSDNGGKFHLEWGESANKLQFEDINGGTKVQFDMSAPSYSLVIASSGSIGLGTLVPAASLEVRRSNGTAQILVDERSGTSATRTLFALKNSGLTKFLIENTQAAVTWAFANKGTSFRISRQGSGEVEMEVFNNGNVTIQGNLTENSDVNAKTNIEAIDERSVLERISAMPITQWQYKDAPGENHIGPMAQDFYAAFGLGKSETGIATIDTAGVALAAIKALSEQNRALRLQVQSQNERLAALEDQQVNMQAMMATLLEAQRASPILTTTAMQ